MAKKGTRRRAHRRDRRKAKQSGYTRMPKTNMGVRIGHGSHGFGGPSGIVRGVKKTARRVEGGSVVLDPLKVSLGEIAAGRRRGHG